MSIYQTLLDKLEDYKATHKTDRAAKVAIEQFILSHPDCFERTCKIGHITSSAWILHPTEIKACLMFHRKLNKWLQAGGHVDGNPNCLESAKREAFEELGFEELKLVQDKIFDLDVHEIPARKNEPAHFHYDIRYLLQAKTNEIIRNNESTDARWFDLAEIQHLDTDDSVKRMARKASSILSPLDS